MADLEERLQERETARQTKSERALDALGEGTSVRPKKKPVAKPVKKKPVAETVGTGAPSFDLEGALAKIEAQIRATTNPSLVAKLKARQQALKDNAQ